MKNYISRHLYQSKVEINCGSIESTYKGTVDYVVDNVLVLDTDDDKIYVSIDKIYYLKEVK